MPKQIELTAEQKAAIDNYGSEIKTLKDFVTAVRRKPGMYIGGTGAHAFINCQREIYSNSIDQILAQDSPANWFSYYYNEQNCEVRVEDNGKSLPFDRIIDILTKNHTSKNFEKKPFDFSTGNHGSGSKITNALSECYIVEAYHYDGTAVKVEFNKGYPVSKSPKKIPNKEHKQGLVTYFIPDREILGDDLYVPWKTIYKKIKQVMSLTPIGSICDFTAIDINGKTIKEHIVNTDGIVSDLIVKVNAPINKPIVISDNTDGIHKMDVAFCYDAGGQQGPSDSEDVTSFANFSPTRGGTHVDGTIEGICRWFTQYMNNIYLSNTKGKIKITYADIKTGLCVCISACHLDPVLVGQSKELLDNQDMVGYCKEVIMKGLDDWSKSNPGDLQKLCKFFKEMAELRLKQEQGKAKIVTKYQKNPLKNLPQKYIRPTTDKDTELIIVEGDSALGTCRLARNKECQGLMPIRGKIINAFTASRNDFFNNEEVQAIIQIIFGQEYRKGLTLKDVKVSKVIFACDADVDGSHIASLLERMFLLYFPFMIEAGMVYKAIPPLYSIKEGKRTRYFTEQIDMVKYVQKVFLVNNTLLTSKKETISNKEITLFLITNADYTYYLEKLANTYSLNIDLVEIILYHYINNKNSINITKLDKEINSTFRFMHCVNRNKIPTVIGSIELSNFVAIQDNFINDASNVLNILKNNKSLYYYFNNKKSSLYTIMKVYNKAMPSNVQRYKGLGEMDKEELSESTLYPGSDRTLIRYTIDSVKEAIDTVRSYESNRKKILDLVGNVTRDDLLD